MGPCFSHAEAIQPAEFIQMIRLSKKVENSYQFNLYGRLDRCEMMIVVHEKLKVFMHAHTALTYNFCNNA